MQAQENYNKMTNGLTVSATHEFDYDGTLSDCVSSPLSSHKRALYLNDFVTRIRYSHFEMLCSGPQ